MVLSVLVEEQYNIVNHFWDYLDDKDVENKCNLLDSFLHRLLHKLKACTVDYGHCDIAQQVYGYQTEDNDFINFHLSRYLLQLCVINDCYNGVGQQNKVDCNGCQKSETKPVAQLLSYVALFNHLFTKWLGEGSAFIEELSFCQKSDLEAKLSNHAYLALLHAYFWKLCKQVHWSVYFGIVDCELV